MADTAGNTLAALQTPPGRGGIAVITLTGPGADATLSAIFRPCSTAVRGFDGKGVTSRERKRAVGSIEDARVAENSRAAAPDNACSTAAPGCASSSSEGCRGLRSPDRDEATTCPPKHGCSATLRKPRHLRLGQIIEPSGQVLDEAIVAPCRHGYEINIHGGPHVVRRTLELLAQAGATIAAPPVADESFPNSHPNWNNPTIGGEMLDAIGEAHSQLVIAALSQQWSAGISRLARGALALLDRALLPPEIRDRLQAASDALPLMLRLLAPAEVVLAGPPNAGKSSLANAMVGRPVSIVHSQARTTRDWVRERAQAAGVPIWLTDTAGLFELDVYATAGPQTHLDNQAVQRALARIQAADLVLWVSAGGQDNPPPSLHAKPLLRVSSKADATPPPPGSGISVSSVTSQGLEELAAAIRHALGLSRLNPAAPMAFTPRQANLLQSAATANAPAKAKQALLELLEG